MKSCFAFLTTAACLVCNASIVGARATTSQNHSILLRLRNQHGNAAFNDGIAWDGNDKSNDADDVARFLQERIGEVDELTLSRYKAAPKGFRKPPIYYSESYLPRANPNLRTDAAKAALAKEWGSWKFVDSKAASRPGNEFYDAYPNRDVPYSKFPADTAWQTDVKYLEEFIPEALALVERGMEAILTEYGRGPKDMPGKPLEERMIKFQLSITSGYPGTSSGGGAMDARSYAGFKRRLLHSIMTEDSFNFAMGGHSAAAGHGNHFQQSYTLQIQKILEPVFARLGVKMSARNFGMGGLGTSQNALAAGDIYGRDVDVLMWDSQMTERDSSRRNFFVLQGLLGSHRAPFQWSSSPSAIKGLMALAAGDVGGTGNAQAGGWLWPNGSDFEALPWEVQYLVCPKEFKNVKASCKSYNGTCWVDRTNFVWEGMDLSMPGKTGGGMPGGQASWHPGYHHHQIIGRTFAFSTLQALRDIFLTWKEKKPNYKWEDSDWHVTEHYKTIQDNVKNHSEQFYTWCRGMQVSTKFCSFPAQGRTEFTPRNRPWAMSLRAIISGSGHAKAHYGCDNAYDPPDVFNPWVNPVDEGQVDVLAILENGVLPFRKNLARVRDSAEGLLLGPVSWTDANCTGSKHNPEIKGGKGWMVESGGVRGTDNCDGQYESFCKRGWGCKLSGHNDGRNGLVFDSFSGWLIFNLSNLEHGLIVAQIYHFHMTPPELTKGWCSENNETPCKARRTLSSSSNTSTVEPNDAGSSSSVFNTTSSAVTTTSTIRRRSLGRKPSPPWCDAFRFEFAIDGNITSWNKTEFYKHKVKSDRVVELVTLMDDDSWKGKRDVELAMRIQGCGRTKFFSLTHLYWI